MVLADPAGCAWLSAADDDWLILRDYGGAGFGLISRSVWSETGPHGCVHCEHLQPYECSRTLTDTVAALRHQETAVPAAAFPDPDTKTALRKKPRGDHRTG